MHIPVIDSPFLIIAAFIFFILTATGVVLVLWIAMPFSVFGVKRRLEKIASEQEKTNRLLEALVDSVRKGAIGTEENKEPGRQAKEE